MPKVSVIIPVYNVEKYLRQCLDSIVNQTLHDIEIICVDDSSTDSSYTILQEYAKKDNRIVILQQQNTGAGAARNMGIDVAQGEYVHFLDADDYLLNDAYEKLYQTAKLYNVDFVKAKAYCFDNNTGEQVSDPYYELQILQKNEFNHVYCFLDIPEKFCKVAVVPWNGIYKRSFLLEHDIKFNHLPCVNDRSFCNDVLIHADSFMFVDEYILYYRINNTQSLIGKRGQYFYCHFESYKLIQQQCDILSPYARAAVLNAELSDLFIWYKRLRESKQLSESVFQQLKDFLANLNIDEILNQNIYCEWYDEYRLIFDEKYKKSPTVLKIFKHYQSLGFPYVVNYVRKYGVRKLIFKIKERIF